MGLFGLFGKRNRKKTTLKPKGKNCVGERLDRLTADGDLPFGWVAHNKQFVDAQQNKINQQLAEVGDAKGNAAQLEAFRAYFNTVDEVGRYCKKKGPCHYRWFTYYIIESQWYNNTIRDFRNLQKKAGE